MTARTTPTPIPTPPEGVPAPVWAQLADWDGHHWRIPERDASGEVIGTAYRSIDGSKSFKRGGRRGLILAWPLPAYAGSSKEMPVFVCEGASDTAAIMGLGLDAVGTPMSGMGGEYLSTLLNDRHVVIMSDADQAGRRGAQTLLDNLPASCPSVRVIEPPLGAKDARAAVVAGAGRQDFLATVAAARFESAERSLPALVTLSDIVVTAVDWLWKGRLARGKLSLIAGDPGVGKSFVTVDLAARVTAGREWPGESDSTQEPGGVVLLNAEDDLGDTICPRLVAAGANLSRIKSLRFAEVPGTKKGMVGRMLDLTRDLCIIEKAIRETPDCRLVIIDPVTAYLGSLDSHKNGDVRGLLAPLSELASRLKVAVVAVTHLNKSAGGPAIYRTTGSLAFTAAARAVLLVAKDPNDPERRVFLPIKNNIGSGSEGLAFRLRFEEDNDTPTVEWENGTTISMTAEAALAVTTPTTSTAVQEATDWLLDLLSQGPRPAKEIHEQARKDGVASRTLDRAKRSLQVKKVRLGFGTNGKWIWHLPDCAPNLTIDRQLPLEAGNGDSIDGAQSSPKSA